MSGVRRRCGGVLRQGTFGPRTAWPADLSNDMLIAAHALSLVLVTDNVREFSQIEGLDLENWRDAPGA